MKGNQAITIWHYGARTVISQHSQLLLGLPFCTFALVGRCSFLTGTFNNSINLFVLIIQKKMFSIISSLSMYLGFIALVNLKNQPLSNY